MDKSYSPVEYKKIYLYFIFDTKYNRQYKARLVADKHLSDIPLSSAYLVVVSLRGIRLVLI